MDYSQTNKLLEVSASTPVKTPSFPLRHSIGGRILAGFGVMVVISLVVALASIYATGQSGTELSKLVQQDQEVTSTILSLELAVESQFSSVRAFLLLTNNPEIGSSELAKARQDFDNAFNDLIKRFDEARIDRNSFAEVQSLYAEFNTSLNEVKSVDTTVFQLTAKSVLERKAREQKETIIQLFDNNLEVFRAQIGKRIDDARMRSTLVTMISLVLVFVAAIGGVIVSSLITRSITRPLRTLARLAETIRQGDLTVAVPRTRGRDEVASLGGAMANMTENLRTSRQRIEAALYEAEERNRELKAINRVSATVSGSLNLDTILNEALDELMVVTKTEYGSLFLLDDTGQYLLLITHRNQNEEYIEDYRRLRVGERLTGKVAATGEVIVKQNMQTDPALPPVIAQHQPDKNFYLGIPLQSKGRSVGVVNLASATNQTISQRDLDLLKTIGNQVAIAIENAQLYNQAQQLAALEERNRLARDLHDSVTQTLFSITLTAESARAMLVKKPERVLTQLDRLQTLARGALAEMRSLIFQLRPAALEEQGLIAALQKHTAAMQIREHLTIEFVVEGERRLSNEHEQALYRIAQEALNNIVKHAQATNVLLSLKFDEHEVIMTVKDNGVGFDPDGEAAQKNRAQKSLGMTSMHERAVLAGGTFEIQSSPGQGTTITVRLPLAFAPRPVGMGIN